MHLKNTLRLALCAVLTVLVAACATITYQDPFGGKWTIDPKQGSPTQPPPSTTPPAGCVPKVIDTQEYNGKMYEMVDTNCDGTPDFARGVEDGLYYPIRPAYTPVLSGTSPVATGKGGIQIDRYSERQETFQIVEQIGFLDPIDFGLEDQSAAEWLTQYGLNDWDGGVVQSNVLMFSIDSDSGTAEVAFPWSSAMLIPPAVSDGMLIDWSGVMDDTGPAFFVVHIGGTIEEVANYMLGLSESGAFTYSFIDDSGNQIGLVAREGEGMWVSKNGHVLKFVSLE